MQLSIWSNEYFVELNNNPHVSSRRNSTLSELSLISAVSNLTTDINEEDVSMEDYEDVLTRNNVSSESQSQEKKQEGLFYEFLQ